MKIPYSPFLSPPPFSVKLYVLTIIHTCDIMKKLHRDNKIAKNNSSEKGGCIKSLCSNKGNLHPPFLDALPTNIPENEEELIKYLAKVLVDIFLNSEAFYGSKEKSSDILPGFDQRTG